MGGRPIPEQENYAMTTVAHSGHRWDAVEAAAAGRESGVCRWRKGLHHRLRDADPARLPEVLLAEAVKAEQRFTTERTA